MSYYNTAEIYISNCGNPIEGSCMTPLINCPSDAYNMLQGMELVLDMLREAHIIDCFELRMEYTPEVRYNG